jgi:hypothetical protein
LWIDLDHGADRAVGPIDPHDGRVVGSCDSSHRRFQHARRKLLTVHGERVVPPPEYVQLIVNQRAGAPDQVRRMMLWLQDFRSVGGTVRSTRIRATSDDRVLTLRS